MEWNYISRRRNEKNLLEMLNCSIEEKKIGSRVVEQDRPIRSNKNRP